MCAPVAAAVPVYSDPSVHENGGVDGGGVGTDSSALRNKFLLLNFQASVPLGHCVNPAMLLSTIVHSCQDCLYVIATQIRESLHRSSHCVFVFPVFLTVSGHVPTGHCWP